MASNFLDRNQKKIKSLIYSRYYDEACGAKQVAGIIYAAKSLSNTAQKIRRSDAEPFSALHCGGQKIGQPRGGVKFAKLSLPISKIGKNGQFCRIIPPMLNINLHPCLLVTPDVAS